MSRPKVRKLYLIVIVVLVVTVSAGVLAYRHTAARFCWNRAVDITCRPNPDIWRRSILEYLLPIEPWRFPSEHIPQEQAALYYLGQFLAFGGAKNEPLFSVIAGQAYSRIDKPKKAIESFLSAPDSVLDSNEVSLGSSSYMLCDYSPRQLLVLEYIKIEHFDDALNQCRLGEERTRDRVVRERYKKLRELIEKKSESAMEEKSTS